MKNLPLLLGVLACVTQIAGPLGAQNIFTVGDGSAMPGNNVIISVQIAHDDPVLGFSYGVRHNGAVLTPLNIAEGSALAPLNGGTGADYFFQELNPSNGPGVIVACIFTFGGSLESLPAGSGQEVAAMEYSMSASASPGSSSALDPATDLGSPPTNIVFTVGGASVFPATEAGSVTVEVPAPTGVSSTLADICDCTHQVNWTNNAAYSSVQVRVGGTLVATVPGSATSATVTLPTSTTDICVRGLVGPVSSTDSCTTGACPVFVPPGAPDNLACSILTTDPINGCTVEANWANQGDYSLINVYLDGVLQSSEAGATTNWQSSLALSPNSQQICIEAVDICGGVLGQICCDVICDAGPIFIRGDCNVDGANNIADVVAALGFLFAGAGIPLCGDACDINDDGGFDISDAVYLLSNLFSDGNFPPAPYPNCGIDPTDTDPMDCDSFPPCL
ncbi:MAG TPA: hypothetical protein EYO84_02885 [Planctomycetes bacterium]|nr:hypothetical protein [Planctomycetota bacterium]